MAMGIFFMAICLISVVIGEEWVRAEMVHHVVGSDRGWDPDSNIASWSSDKDFRVGDKIWFTYSAAQESIVELKSKEEYDACDVSNPIRTFTEGLDILPLVEEGIRYFASGKHESCKNGLKLHVEVQSPTKPDNQNGTTSLVSTAAAADGPTTPSASPQLNGPCFAFLIGLLVAHFVL